MLEMYERLGEQAGELLVFSLRPFLRLADPTPQPYSATRRHARGFATPSHGTNACSTLWLQGTKRSGSRQKLAGHAWIGQRYEFSGTPWRQRHYVPRLSPERSFVVTGQCPQGAMIFAAADQLTNLLALPRYNLSRPTARRNRGVLVNGRFAELMRL